MKSNFIQTEDGQFVLHNKEIMLRGVSIGSWMDLENFMIKIPGTERSIRHAYSEVYGKENAEQFFDDFLHHFITEDDFIFLKSLGINVIRLPFDYRHFVEDQSPGLIKMDGFTHLDRVLELCNKFEIYAILDLHSSPGGQNPDSHGGGETGVSGFWQDASLRERMIHLWRVIARRYKDQEIIAGYDILNEPSFVSDRDAFNDFYEKVIHAIREEDPHHILFLEGDDWAKDFSIFTSLGGYQQALSFHFYPGQHVYLNTEVEKRRAELEAKIAYFTELRKQTGMPLWAGETGGHFPNEHLWEGLLLIKDCLDLFEKNRISWTLWSYKDAGAMGMVRPQEDTDWMSFAKTLRYQWERKDRSYSTIAKEIFEMLEMKFSYIIEDSSRESLKFRIFSLLNELHIHHLVKPTLRSIPWEEMKRYPESFLFMNCEGGEELVELVKSYTGVLPKRAE
ncbi:glycoside hydrolase family 5 protein [Gorillibacterium timonense]|uniref:glycoside hydrolase family 5 protein n=1 Tax=Gorillibacterium timonense TaxID=1689269 RepID=UPI00071E4958|nr:glycoside hydrolase family 5 protein [Gorillibacterium timonense]